MEAKGKINPRRNWRCGLFRQRNWLIITSHRSDNSLFTHKRDHSSVLILIRRIAYEFGMKQEKHFRFQFSSWFIVIFTLGFDFDFDTHFWECSVIMLTIKLHKSSHRRFCSVLWLWLCCVCGSPRSFIICLSFKWIKCFNQFLMVNYKRAAERKYVLRCRARAPATLSHISSISVRTRTIKCRTWCREKWINFLFVFALRNRERDATNGE